MEYTMGTAVFNDWIITEKIGQGASGQVYKIKKNGSEGMYSALKVIRIPQSPFEIQTVMSEGMTEDEATDYFKGFIDEICSEIKIMISLKEHPNIVTYESHSVIPHRNEIGWDILIKMELLTPLLNWQMSYPLDEKDIIRLGCEISSALVYVADYNLIHRDIKPENIFVDASGKFKLGDFGIARTLEKTTGGLSRKGTDSYMAPEVYQGKIYNAQADIYSLGIVLYRFLNDNRLPFYPPKTETFTYSDRETALMKRIQGLPLPEPVTGSEELKKAVLKACEYLPENRYENMSGFHNALQKLIGDGVDGQGGGNPPPPPPSKWFKLVLVGALLFIFAGSVFAVVHLNAKTRENQLTVADRTEIKELQAEEKTTLTTNATEEYQKKIEVEIKHGEGSGVYDAATGSIPIHAEKIEKFRFLYWAIEEGDVDIKDPDSEETSISFNKNSGEKIIISAKYEIAR